jgi:hypothetical protein
VTPIPVSAVTLVELGETETEIGRRGAIVSWAEADWAVSATEIALSNTDEFAGIAGGGVYVVGLELGVVSGATDPHAGEQGVPLWVRVH